MVGKTNVGGGGGSSTAEAYAYIHVTYPSGSVCTATNGSITLTAADTVGAYVFHIPQPSSSSEDWTVSCTDGTKTVSTTASVSAHYSVVSVVLLYSRLPEGYQEVEYIESPSTGYVNQSLTGPTIDEQIEIDFMMLNDLEHSVFGITSGYAPAFGLGYHPSQHTLAYYWGKGESQSIVPTTASIGTKISAVINNANHHITENGTQISSSALSGSCYSNRFTIGGSLDNSGTYGVVSTGTTRFYKYIRTNLSTGTVLQNFVPCYAKASSNIGFYDLANSAFIQVTGVGGSAVWLKGPDV